MSLTSYEKKGILDVPDIIHFEGCAVNYTTSKTILVRNIGEAPAKFNAQTSAPFTVSPDSGFLKPYESMQLTIDFHPHRSLNYSEDLMVTYDSGEVTHTGLRASTAPMDIFLNTNSVDFGSHFITTSAMMKVQLVNHSDLMVSYSL